MRGLRHGVADQRGSDRTRTCNAERRLVYSQLSSQLLNTPRSTPPRIRTSTHGTKNRCAANYTSGVCEPLSGVEPETSPLPRVRSTN